MPSLDASAPPTDFAKAAALVLKHDYKDAVSTLDGITKDGRYKDTAYAPAAIYRIAEIDRDYIRDQGANNDAIQRFHVLLTTYDKTTYPGSATVANDRDQLTEKLDSANAGNFLYKVIDFSVGLTGRKSYSYWLSLLLIAVIVRLVITPLSLKQYAGMREMQRIQPELKKVQEKYASDKQLQGQKMMELYKEHNVNPMAGCLPILLQMPIFWFMYQGILQYQYHFSRGEFLWINDKFAIAASHIYPGIVGRNLAEPDIILLVIYSISMYVTQRMTPVTDPTQAETQKTMALMMPVMFFFMFMHITSAFVLYWLFTNILGSVTQVYFMKQGVFPGSAATNSNAGILTIPEQKTLNAPSDEANNSTSRKLSSAKPTGAARGVIAPRTHPKKKRR
jgi:YidC/Oxa1 family membrane protein insertase